MKNILIFKIGSSALATLGIIHLLAHFAMVAPDDAQSVIDAMTNYKLELFGEHSLMKFHNGFSVMMGFLMLLLGVQNYLLAPHIINNKSILSIIILGSLILLGIALYYFHILAYGFLFFSSLCYVFTYIKVQREN